MSGLALVARALGAEVSGSDQTDSSYCARLRELGIDALLGHSERNLPPRAEVVVSTAIPEDNPELAAARSRGAAVVHRGDLLGEVSRLKRCLAVAGTHGKTTTASMTAHAILSCGGDPAYLIGGELRSTGANAAWGGGEWLVVEVDESDRSLLKVQPEVAVITSAELDHHATYRTVGELEQVFAQFIAPAATRVLWERVRLPKLGTRDGAGQRAAEGTTYGIGAGDLAAEDLELLPLGSRFVVEGVDVELRVPGRHNVLNALAALGACRAAGVGIGDAAASLSHFSGAGRRFEWRGRATSGAMVFDDYAHHPTEVRATLDAARTLRPERLVACFQPHLYSRTCHLARDFGRALALADLVVVLEVYPARERAKDFPGVSGWRVATATADAADGRPVFWAPDMDDAERLLRDVLRAGDVLLTLGAGDVDRLAARLASPSSAAVDPPHGLGTLSSGVLSST